MQVFANFQIPETAVYHSIFQVRMVTVMITALWDAMLLPS
jgi:hypothetical protein